MVEWLGKNITQLHNEQKIIESRANLHNQQEAVKTLTGGS